MCLDWLDHHDEAETYFSQAETLDPNGYYTVAVIGWHYVQTGDYAAAKSWFERSLNLEPHDINVARPYLELVEQKLAEKASGKNTMPTGF
jgi:Flp pilus assembly protein TadD